MRPLVLIAALAVAAGCSSEEKLFDVSGSVTFDGKPVPKGMIFFDPDPSKGGSGGQGYAVISDGRYATADTGKGVKGGAYTVRVSAYDGKDGLESPFGNGLCPEHTVSRELPAAPSTLDVDLPSPGKRR